MSTEARDRLIGNSFGLVAFLLFASGPEEMSFRENFGILAALLFGFYVGRDLERQQTLSRSQGSCG